MYETRTLPIPKNAEKVFLFFLNFYPRQYRKRFGQEIFLVFQDICDEELEKHNTLSFKFWLRQIQDIARSTILEHISEIKQKGMKKYLQQTLRVNTHNIVSIVFLLPVILMTSLEVLSRIAQRDLTHYNRPVYAFFSHTFLYWTPVLFTWVILFPLLATIISLIPLAKSLVKNKASLFSLAFLQKNILGIAIFLFGLGFIMLIRLHDFLPCVMYGLTHFGFGQLSHILSVCKKA